MMAMDTDLAPDDVIEMGKVLEEVFLDTVSIKRFLARHKTKDIFSHYELKEVLAQYKPEERLAGLSIDEVEAYLRQLKQPPSESNQKDLSATVVAASSGTS